MQTQPRRRGARRGVTNAPLELQNKYLRASSCIISDKNTLKHRTAVSTLLYCQYMCAIFVTFIVCLSYFVFVYV